MRYDGGAVGGYGVWAAFVAKRLGDTKMYDGDGGCEYG